jgi:hypothetical protein
MLAATLTSRTHTSTMWPIWVTTVYRRQGGPEKRTALINCQLNADRPVNCSPGSQGEPDQGGRKRAVVIGHRSTVRNGRVSYLLPT